jgi:flagellar export protein FliJ
VARSTFKFRLQRLLDVRIMREQLAQQELVRLRQVVLAEEQRLRDMQQAEIDLREEQRVPFGRGDDLHQFQMRRHFLEQAIKDNVQGQTEQHSVIGRAQQAVRDQQDVLKQRGIEVKALEKMREKQREEHRLDQLREEGLFMDDLAGQGFLRRRTIATQVHAEEQLAREMAAADAPPPPSAAPRPPDRPQTSEAAS